MNFKLSAKDIKQIQNFLMLSKFKLKSNVIPPLTSLPRTIITNVKKIDAKKYMKAFSTTDQMKIKKLIPFFSDYTKNKRFQVVLASAITIDSDGSREEMTKKLQNFKKVIKKSTSSTKQQYAIASIIVVILWGLLMKLRNSDSIGYVAVILSLFVSGLYLITKEEKDASGDVTLNKPRPSGSSPTKKKPTATSDEFLL